MAGDDFRHSVEGWDRAFAEGRLDDFTSIFTEDARLLIHQQDPVVGKDAIRVAFSQVFEGFDTSAYDPRYEVMDVYDDRAYVLGSFSEVLRPRSGGPGMRVRGRVVHFWRREAEDWRVAWLLTSRSAPDELEA